VTSRKLSPVAARLPTISESGLIPAIDAIAWPVPGPANNGPPANRQQSQRGEIVAGAEIGNQALLEKQRMQTVAIRRRPATSASMIIAVWKEVADRPS